MPKQPPTDPKLKTLRDQGTLNPRPEAVRDPLFHEHDFFDAHDLVQVKYEMLRRINADKQPVTATAVAFGFSRPTIYQAQSAVRREGLAGLVPKKRGPRGGHKLDEKVLAFISEQRASDPKLRPPEFAQRIKRRFQIKVHPRTIERALSRQKKKRQ